MEEKYPCNNNWHFPTITSYYNAHPYYELKQSMAEQNSSPIGIIAQIMKFGAKMTPMLKKYPPQPFQTYHQITSPHLIFPLF